MMKQAVIELGSNIGNRVDNIRKAILSIERLPKTLVLDVSKYYETEPFSVPDKQNNYINCCIKVSTDLLPYTLLGACLGIEAAMGRLRPFKNASRIIDIDLLIYENEIVNTPDLVLPHPRMLKRAFVLVPLKDLYPDMNALGIDFKSNLKELSDDVNKISIV